jgi:copper homeostasis protein
MWFTFAVVSHVIAQDEERPIVGLARWKTPMIPLEICVESLESAVAAEQGGAQRVELCSALSEGGLTPSFGLIRAVRQHVGIAMHVIVRPRAGDFLYSSDEIAIMREDIRVAAEAGADGVVFGLLTADGDVDVDQTRELVELARPMEVTFHRAIDMSRDIEASLEDVIRTGAVRVLTSGGEASAMEGCPRLQRLLARAAGRIEVMVGGGVRPQNIAEIARALGLAGGGLKEIVAFHASLRHTLPSMVRHQARKVHLGDSGFDDYVRSVVRVEDVSALREALEQALHAEAPVPRRR